MKLEFLYYKDKVNVLNEDGHVGILTMWSKVEAIQKKIGDIPPCVAAISNFYGDGINQLLVNLLNNPQLSHLFLIGLDRTGSTAELINYFQNGVETVKINGSNQFRIKGTTRLVNEALSDTSLFSGREPLIVDCGQDVDLLLSHLSNLEVPSRPTDRIAVKLIEVEASTFPSIRQGHQVVSDSPLDAWAEVLFLIERFGLPTKLAKGNRRELLNLKVVISDPVWCADSDYSRFNLDVDKLREYCRVMLEPVLDAETTYTYGNRLKEYFGYDMVERVVKRLTDDIEDRKCYLSLWDSRLDLNDYNDDGSGRGHPCWVGGFFRVYDDYLTLSVTFRTHRAYTAWIENVHGLMSLQSEVASRLGLSVGPLTVFSHSISIDPGQLALVGSITKSRKWKMRDDGRGEVVFSIDDGKVVVEHRMFGIVLKRYVSANIEALSHQLAQDHIVSDLNHALYVGRQLGKLQVCLSNNLPYVES